ncbi:hypothetical protein ECG_09076 [Echinococcus granulosus]|uniref:Expressed protein n=1 Tax=Echinococcus granulosus TaxID=6210 RepID=A0A068WNK3_ECHGR|nr:hypothetical protein ECG_09076 [Echinococcus granulosus]CDS21330.1 expressed protein [Echinococcus granulosus]
MLYYFVYAPITPPQKHKLGTTKSITMCVYACIPYSHLARTVLYIFTYSSTAAPLFYYLNALPFFSHGCIRDERPTVRFTHLKTFCGMA